MSSVQVCSQPHMKKNGEEEDNVSRIERRRGQPGKRVEICAPFSPPAIFTVSFTAFICPTKADTVNACAFNNAFREKYALHSSCFTALPPLY